MVVVDDVDVVVVVQVVASVLGVHVVVVVAVAIVVADPVGGLAEAPVVVLVAVAGGVVVVAEGIHVVVVVVVTDVVTSAVAGFAATLELICLAVVAVINFPGMVVVEAVVEIILESGMVELTVVAVGAIVICMDWVEFVAAAVSALFVVLGEIVEDLVAAFGARKPSLRLVDASALALTNIGWWDKSSVIAIEALAEVAVVVAVLVVVEDTSACKGHDPPSVEELRG